MKRVPEHEQLRGRVFLYPVAAAPESLLLAQQCGSESGQQIARFGNSIVGNARNAAIKPQCRFTVVRWMKASPRAVLCNSVRTNDRSPV
jgi:hypothetical protein